jgi:hypothetical protein
MPLQAAQGAPDPGAVVTPPPLAPEPQAPLATAPPAVAPVVDLNHSGVLSHRYREETLLSIARVAKEKGLTQKQLFCRALEALGVQLHPADRGVRAPPRRRMDEV